MKQTIITRTFVLGFLLIGILFPLQGFAGLFDDDEKRWDYLFKSLKKINLRLSVLETKEIQTLKQAQGQIYSQLEDIQNILPSLQGIVETTKSDINNKVSNLLAKTEEIQTLAINQEQRMQSDLASMKNDLGEVVRTINEILENHKVGIIKEFGLIKEGIATDIKSLADSNAQSFKNFSEAEAKSLKQIVENISTTNKILNKELIPAIIQENKNTLNKIIAKIGQDKEEIFQQYQTNQITLIDYLNSIKKQDEKLIQILEKTLTVQQTNFSELKNNQKNVFSSITQNSKILDLINTNIKTVADGIEKTNTSVNTSITKLQEVSNQNTDKLIKIMGNNLNIFSQKVGENQASTALANEKLAKLIEILKTIAVSQARVDEVVVAQKQMVQSQDQIIAAQQQMSAAQNNVYENQSKIVETQKLLAKAQEQAIASREKIIRTQAEIKEALADLRRKANVNIARNDDIKKKQGKIEKALKASGVIK